MRTEVKSMAKVCRIFQLKLKKSEEKSQKLKAENAQLARTVKKDLRRRHQSLPHLPSGSSDRSRTPVPAPQGGTNEMVKSAVIWGYVAIVCFILIRYECTLYQFLFSRAVLVAGYSFLKSKMN